MDLSNNEFNSVLPMKYFENFMAMINADNEEMKYMGKDNFIFYQDSLMVTMKGMSIELVRIQTILTTIDLSKNKFSLERFQR